MREDAASKAERYRKAANRYGEMAKEAEPGYLAEVFRKVAVRYVFMADDALNEARVRGDLVPQGTAIANSPWEGPPDAGAKQRVRFG
jgi:hypothetical protein